MNNNVKILPNVECLHCEVCCIKYFTCIFSIVITWLGAFYDCAYLWDKNMEKRHMVIMSHSQCKVSWEFSHAQFDMISEPDLINSLMVDFKIRFLFVRGVAYIWNLTAWLGLFFEGCSRTGILSSRWLQNSESKWTAGLCIKAGLVSSLASHIIFHGEVFSKDGDHVG